MGHRRINLNIIYLILKFNILIDIFCSYIKTSIIKHDNLRHIQSSTKILENKFQHLSLHYLKFLSFSPRLGESNDSIP